MLVELMIWTMVAAAPYKPYQDWRHLTGFDRGNFQSAAVSCHNAAYAMGIQKDRYRCIDKLTGKAV